MQVVFAEENAYVTVIGAGVQQYAAMTFALHKVSGDWKITSQSWTQVPPVDLRGRAR